MRQLIDRYLEEHASKLAKRNRDDQASMLRKLVEPAWAGTGDGVLAIDANNDGRIDRREEIVFTAWDATAKTDFEALRSVFDSNANGRLEAGDARFGQFRIVVNGVVKTLSELGIVSIDLNSNRVGYVLSDGSSIDGEARFTRADGSTGTAADVTVWRLVA